MSLRRTLLCFLIVASASTLGCHRTTAEASGVNNARSGSDTAYAGTPTANGAPDESSAPATNPPGTAGSPGTTATSSPGDAGTVNDARISDGSIGSMDAGGDAGAVSDGGHRGRLGRDAGG